MVMMNTLLLLGPMLVRPMMVMMKTLLGMMLVNLVWKGVEKQQAADYDDGGAARRLEGRSAKLKRLFRRRWCWYRGGARYSRGTRCSGRQR